MNGISTFDTTTISLLLWTILFPTLLFVRRILKLPSAGLDITYLGLFYIGHAPGALLYLLPWYFTYYDGFSVTQGFELSVTGVLAFTIGLGVSLLVIKLISRNNSFPSTSIGILNNKSLPFILFGAGLVSYLIIFPFASTLPSLTSIVVNLNNLQVVGIVLGLYQGISTRNAQNVLLWLVLIPILPFLTVTTSGFLGFGIAAMLAILAFLISQVRFRWWHVLIGVVVLYLSLSLYVTYVRARGEIRSVVWGGEEYAARVDTITSEFGRWEWFDWRNSEHLYAVDGRLNQNSLIGVARFNLEHGLVPYANGDTLQRAWVGFIPRAIWPDKPIVAGGNELVTQFTFIDFAFGTTVAMGQVMEFYVNYGQPGIIIGFGLLGIIFAVIDAKAISHLRNGNFYGFLRWFLPGLAMLKPLDDFSVVTAGAASALVTALLVEYGLKWWYRATQKNKAEDTVVAASPRILLPRP